jgi:hypothetical protein
VTLKMMCGHAKEPSGRCKSANASPMTVWPSVADRPLRPYRSAHFGPRFAWIPTAPIDTREELLVISTVMDGTGTGRQFILQAARLSSERPLCVRWCVYRSITARGR